MKDLNSLFAAILLGLFPSAGSAAELDLNILGAAPADGQFLVSVFANEANWMKNPTKQEIIQVTSNGTGSVSFNLQPGTYGIAVAHDANADGKINVNGLGIPVEAFGFSNNARALLGPPKFDSASFKLHEPGEKLAIRLGRAR